MGLLKRWMTEILLDVTDSEMRDVAKETVQYEKGKHQLSLSILTLCRVLFKSDFY